MIEQVAFEVDDGTVSGAWHHPTQGNTYVVLAHGAGGNLNTPGLTRYAEGLANRGIGAIRFNFPYAEAKRKIPDRAPRLEAAFRAVAEKVRSRASILYLGGRSMGGRIASHLLADGFGANGLICMSYPLHPPGQPDRRRDEHLRRITVPMLFLQGSQDAFAKMNLLRNALTALPTATLHVIEGADHSLRVKGRTEPDVITELVEATLNWLKRN